MILFAKQMQRHRHRELTLEFNDDFICLYVCLSRSTTKAETILFITIYSEQSQSNSKYLLGQYGGGDGNLLQFSCLENPVERGVSQATVHVIMDMAERQLVGVWVMREHRILAVALLHIADLCKDFVYTQQVLRHKFSVERDT